MTTSKTITIFRTRTFLSESQKGLDEYLGNSKQSIGGYWASTSSSAQGTGLTPTEVDLLLPYVLDISSLDREFRAKVKEFYERLETPVPYVTGKTLKISLTDDEKPLSKDNLPVEMMDYIRYRHAIKNPEVAMSKDDATGNQLKKFYVHNQKEVKKSNTSLREKREEAMTLYLKLAKDETKVDNVLALFGEDPRKYSDLSDKLEFLEKKAQATNLEALIKFVEVAEDTQLEDKAFVAKLVKTGVFRQVGSRYLVAETSEVIGDTLEETIMELAEEGRSELIIVLKARLQDEMKKSITSVKNIKASNSRT